jgi:hypothetical protein
MINFIVLTDSETGQLCMFNVNNISNIKPGLTKDTTIIYSNLYSKLITTVVNEDMATIISMLQNQR